MSLGTWCVQHWFKSNLHGRNASCSSFLLSGTVWRNCLPRGCRGWAGVVWPCFGQNIHLIANCSWSAQWYLCAGETEVSPLLNGTALCPGFSDVCYVCTHWPSRQLFREAKRLWPHCLLQVLPERWRSRRALCCCFGERSLPDRQGNIPLSSVHIIIWLQKAGVYSWWPASHLTALSLTHLPPHGWNRPPCPVPSPNHWKHQHFHLLTMLKSPEL